MLFLSPLVVGTFERWPKARNSGNPISAKKALSATPRGSCFSALASAKCWEIQRGDVYPKVETAPTPSPTKSTVALTSKTVILYPLPPGERRLHPPIFPPRRASVLDCAPPPPLVPPTGFHSCSRKHALHRIAILAVGRAILGLPVLSGPADLRRQRSRLRRRAFPSREGRQGGQTRPVAARVNLPPCGEMVGEPTEGGNFSPNPRCLQVHPLYPYRGDPRKGEIRRRRIQFSSSLPLWEDFGAVAKGRNRETDFSERRP